MPRLVTWPLLLRPPVLVLPSVRALTGRPLKSPVRSMRTRPRCDGVVGLYCLSAIGSDSRGHVDRLAVGQANDRFLEVRPLVGRAFPALGLALLDDRVDADHRHAEQR